ncbi:hypothetical protein BJF78_26215 [Pseudonocardia sp. CNS-139]|nr:hypothetical protein BJF78_26215 [Pseudonocardia sp. CNS-139]
MMTVKEPNELTRLVADWADRSPAHSRRLREAAKRNPQLLQRIVFNLLRHGGGPDSTISRLRHALTDHHLEQVDWYAVAERLTRYSATRAPMEGS